MPTRTRLMRTKWYPRPHNMEIDWGFACDNAAVNDDTIIPITMYDEGLGSPTSYEANPEHASFVEASEPNCYPESTVNLVTCNLRLTLTKAALETDKMHVLRFYTQPIFMSFDDILANDEVSGLDIGELLEMQRETTDRQQFPLYNAVDMVAGAQGTTTTLAANVPGLT